MGFGESNEIMTEEDKNAFSSQEGFEEWMFNWIFKEHVVLPNGQPMEMFFLYDPSYECFYASSEIEDCVKAFDKYNTFEG